MMPRRTLPPLASDVEMARFAGDWITPERMEVLKRDWPTQRSRALILSEMAELPGPLWDDPNVVTAYASNGLRLHRPDWRPPVPKPATVILQAKPGRRTTACCFPLNDGRPWKFCDEPHQNQSYCDEHMARCVTRARDRREDAPPLAVMFVDGTSFLFGSHK